MENELLNLATAARRRRRRALAWTASGLVPAAALALIGWEYWVGPLSAWRPAGYAAALVSLLIAAAALLRRRGEAPTAPEVARRVDRLFPQTRGGVAELVSPSPGPLAAARRAAARAWLARHGAERLDAAVGRAERRSARRRRGLALGLAVLAALAVLGAPGAAHRVTAALVSPGSVWRTPTGTWRIAPGDVEVEPGATVAGAARFAGPAVDEPLILERRPAGGSWSPDTLGPRPAGRWRWVEVVDDVEYRLRLGPFVSSVHRVSVRAPLGIVRLEGRAPGGAWGGLAGRTLPAGRRLELRGEASRSLAAAFLEVAGGRRLDLQVDGASFRGAVEPPPGPARAWVRDARGTVAAGEAFQLAAEDAAWVDLLVPEEDPALLTAVHAWLEVRAGSAAGLRDVRWETGDGRSGSLGDPSAARDTTLSGAAPLALGATPGDTLRYRVIALDAAGRRAAANWRTAIVADRSRLAEDARRERQAAADRLTEAIARLREAEEGPADGGDVPGRPDPADERLRRAADSLASALDRALADPGLAGGMAERIEGYRQLLEGTSRAQLAPPPGSVDPRAAAAARASVLEAIRRGLAEVDSLLAVQAGADSLDRLADAEAALAERSRRASPRELADDIAARQDALAESARRAASRLPERLEEPVAAALEGAAEGVRSGDPSTAAQAQTDAATALARAAQQAEASLAADAAEQARMRAALDRAGGQVLFLAEREQELVERLEAGTVAAGRADRVARQRVVTGGLERALTTLVETIGGRPAGADLAERLTEAVYLTRIAEDRVAGAAPAAPGVGDAPAAAAAAADALARLARSLLLPAGGGMSASGAGQGSESGGSPAAAAELEALAAAERSLADALAPGSGEGGNPDAAGRQREIGERLAELAQQLIEAGIDPATLGALEEAVDGVAGRLERGLPGARLESELRTLSRRFADLGRMVDRSAGERRRSRTAGAFLPEHPPELPRRATALRLDPEAALAPWREALPLEALGPGRAYLERLAEEGVRRPEAGP